MVVIKKTKSITPIDEVELALRIMEQNFPEEIKGKTSSEISVIINHKFGINSTGDCIFLLYEPTIEQMEMDMREHFESIGLYY